MTNDVKLPLLKEYGDEEKTVKKLLSKNKWAILGGFFALGSGFTFAFYGFFVKQFDVNIMDTLFVKSLTQVILTSCFIVIRQKNFFLVFEDGEDKRSIFKKYCILILQVRIYKAIYGHSLHSHFCFQRVYYMD